jgi:probable selenium-dependent hydroxylase accessory protein YqeC
VSDFRSFVTAHFPPAAVYAFVGAGGKSTAIRRVAEHCASRGMRVRITTTTRIARDDFPLFPRSVISDLDGFLRALDGAEPVRVIVSAADGAKLIGVDPGFIDAARPGADLIILVEADGSRRRPLKIPTARDPVIPRSTAMVVGMLGASGFGEAITEDCCYNHEAAFALLGRDRGRFDATAVALIAAHPAGLRKGVLPGMSFHVIVSQADVAEKRDLAREAVRAIRAGGAAASLVSWQEERIYEPA